MAQFIVHGKVTSFGPKQRNVRAENEEDIRAFWAAENIDTRLDWAGVGPLLVSMSAQNLVSQCKPGDLVDYTIETWNRSDGKRIRGVAVQVIEPS